MKTALRLLLVALLPGGLLAEENPGTSGRSLFDQLTLSEDGTHRSLPYPFPLLLRQIEERAGFGANDDPLAGILVPRGRSLQREAASPDYYAFPRVVIALDRDSGADRLVKNRLFLGYQERAGTIEVISYNEIAGRFEFQVVENYGADLAPRVSPASRELCTSCHQNGATIFARPLWRETHFNREVAARIAEHHDSYLGIGTSPEHADADRIDFATDQAGLLQTYQRVWQQACPDDACRANLFLATILRRIESEPRPSYQWTARERDLLASLQASWQEHWPDGMPIPGADIPDIADAAQSDVISPESSPLTPRPPADHWSARTAVLRSLEGLAGQFWPPIYLGQLEQAAQTGAIDADRIAATVRNMQLDPRRAPLFAARPIPGAALIQALIDEIEMSR